MNSDGRPVLVAGGGGFIGGWLACVLLARGYRVRCADIKPVDEWHRYDLSYPIGTKGRSSHKDLIPGIPGSEAGTRLNVHGSTSDSLAAAHGHRR